MQEVIRLAKTPETSRPEMLVTIWALDSDAFRSARTDEVTRAN
jgi:hypothetical protein